jgi:hypothetical protein
MPEAWAVEFLIAEGPLMRSFDSAAEQSGGRDFTLASCEAHMMTPGKAEFRCPSFDLAYTVALAPLKGYGHVYDAALVCYVLGCEAALPDPPLFRNDANTRVLRKAMKAQMSQAATDEEKDEIQDDWVRTWGKALASPSTPGTAHFSLCAWDNRTEAFPVFWKALSDPRLFAARLGAWRQATTDPLQRRGVRYVMAWHVARYEAAVRQEPRLAQEAAPAAQVAALRKELSRVPEESP